VETYLLNIIHTSDFRFSKHPIWLTVRLWGRRSHLAPDHVRSVTNVVSLGQIFLPVFPSHYHSNTAPYSFIHLPPTLYNVFLPVLQFSPVSIIPPLLHTPSSIYHPRCIMFFSQYFSFPLSVIIPPMFHTQNTCHQHSTTCNLSSDITMKQDTCSLGIYVGILDSLWRTSFT
jgi:hypothetical protein